MGVWLASYARGRCQLRVGGGAGSRPGQAGGGQALPLPPGVQAQRHARPGVPPLRQLSIPSPPASPDQGSPCRLQEEPLPNDSILGKDTRGYIASSLLLALLVITPTRPPATRASTRASGTSTCAGPGREVIQGKEGSRSGYPGNPNPASLLGKKRRRCQHC